MKLTLAQIKKETDTVYTFLFQPEDPNLNWRAGQYLRYQLDHPQSDERGINRFFTIASAPFEKQIQLTTRMDPDHGSSFKKQLLTLKPGDEIAATGPNGTFVIDNPSAHFVFVTGGIGITPFRSIILDLNHKNMPINITLFYANKTSEVVFQKELEDISSLHPEFKIHYFLGDNTLTPLAINQLVSPIKKQTFYISGPEPMMTSFEKSFIEMGTPEEQIKHDYFPGYTEY